MTTELSMLLFSALLFFGIIMVQALMGISQNGLQAQAGSRDNLPAPNVLRERLQRLISNLQENLVLFTIVVVTAHVAGVLLCTARARCCLRRRVTLDSPSVLGYRDNWDGTYRFRIVLVPPYKTTRQDALAKTLYYFAAVCCLVGDRGALRSLQSKQAAVFW